MVAWNKFSVIWVVVHDGEHGFGLFEAFGVEMEYMIVDQVSLDVAHLATFCFKKLRRAHGGMGMW